MYSSELSVDLRFLIPSTMAGLIIGKAGESINNLRKEYPVKIIITHGDGPERILVLNGALNSVLEVLDQILSKQTHPTSEPMVDLRLLVHCSQAGVIIGRGGGKIREFRENSRLKTIKVYQSVCPDSTDRVVQFVGDPQRIILCLKSIAELIITYPPRSNRIHYDAKKYDEQLAPQYGGWCRSNTFNSNGNADPARRREYDNFNPKYMNPNSESFNKNMMNAFCAVWGDIVSGKINSHAFTNCSTNHGCNTVDSQANGPSVGPAGDTSRLSPGIIQRMNDGKDSIIVSPITTAKVSVSDKMIGAIMGKGGSRINQVRRECGAEIKIGKMNQADGEDRIITITGTPDQIQNAQFLLQVCVRKYGHL